MADNQRIDDLRRRVQRDPASIAFAQLAEELRRAHQFEESVDTCRAGLAIHPGYLSARVTLGRALLELNQLDDALHELETVLKSAPENLAAIRGVAEIHNRNGSLREALAHYRAALALARNDPELQQTVSDLARQVEPPPPPANAEGLSFDQMHAELLKLAPPPVAPPPVVFLTPQIEPQLEPQREIEPQAATHAEAPPDPEPTDPVDPAADITASAVELDVPSLDPAAHAERTIAALEQWLDAVHVARADRRA